MRCDGAPVLLRLVRSSVALLLSIGPIGAPIAATTLNHDLACQRAIENGAHRYAACMLDTVERCAQRSGKPVVPCVEAAFRRPRLVRARRRWGAAARAACAGVDVATRFAYHTTCAPTPADCIGTTCIHPDSACTFPTVRLDRSGADNDILDCVACQIREEMRDLGSVLFGDGSGPSPCRAALGGGGTAALRAVFSELHGCLQDPSAVSIAGCLSDPSRASRIEETMAAWRTQAENRCAGVDVFGGLSYQTFCSREVPARPPFCDFQVRPCEFQPFSVLTTAGGDDDLLDCLRCRVEEAAMAEVRATNGAELCCLGRGCTVRSRVACRVIGGTPSYYRIDTLHDAPIDASHGVAAGGDGTVYFSAFPHEIRAVPRGGTVHAIGTTPGAPFGISVDTLGNVYAGLRQDHRVVLIAPDGTVTPIAGTGIAGHTGDGGPAILAKTAAPNGTAVDAAGNVYFTESGVLSDFLLGTGVGASELVRMVDGSGVVRTVAGDGTFGAGGAGGPALDAQLAAPYSLAAAPDGTILVGDVGFQRVLRFTVGGTLTAVAGRPLPFFGSYAGDGGPALQARLYGIEGLAEDARGNVLIADFRNSRVRLVDPLGSIITVAGNGLFFDFVKSEGDGGPAAYAGVGCPAGLAVAPDGRVYLADLVYDRLRVLTLIAY